MSTVSVKPDVFISYAANDQSTADLVAAALDEQGLEVFRPTKIDAGAKVEEVLWDAIAESSVMVFILPTIGPIPANALVELGAAMAWNRPILLISPTSSPRELPQFLESHKIFPLERLDDVIYQIKSSMRPPSDPDIERLKEAYQELGIPADRLIADPVSIERLAHKYNAGRDIPVSGEQLVTQLFRLRKSSKLPRLVRTSGHH